MIDPFTAPNPLQNAWLFVASFRWNERQDRLADNFFRLVTEEAFGGGIPTGDDSIEIFADDGVV